jgi:hypothetical protein
LIFAVGLWLCMWSRRDRGLERFLDIMSELTVKPSGSLLCFFDLLNSFTSEFFQVRIQERALLAGLLAILFE